MADSPDKPRPAAPEPDIAKLVAMIGAAALSVVIVLAAVATLPIGWILVGSLFPVLCWGLLLRETHRLLRYRGDEPEVDADRDAKRWDPRL